MATFSRQNSTPESGHLERDYEWVGSCGGHESAQHPSAQQLLHRGEVFRCQRAGLGEVDLPVLVDGDYPVDHAAVEVDMDALCDRFNVPAI